MSPFLAFPIDSIRMHPVHIKIEQDIDVEKVRVSI